MKHLIIAAVLAVGGFVSGAEAMPLVPAPASQFIAAGHVVTIDYPCGRGWHLNRRGRCVPHARWDRPPPRWHRPPPRWGHPPRHWHRPPPPGYWRY